MTNEERPITFTIIKTEAGYRMYSKDLRVDEYNREVTFPDKQIFTMMEFASSVYNDKGYAVLFEVG